MARPRPLRGLTETREGRLAVIIVVAGLLVVGLRTADVVAAHKANDAADDVRAALRRDLSELPDATIEAFTRDNSSDVERAAGRALDGQPARLLAIGLTGDTAPPLVLVVETGWAWQARCIRVELRGHGTVLTQARHGHC